jgi:hypothetical protein
MKKALTIPLLLLFLLIITNRAYAIVVHSQSNPPSSTVSGVATQWSGRIWGTCPQIQLSAFGGQCKAVCPSGWELSQDINPQTGEYECQKDYGSWKCVYVNPFCNANIQQVISQYPLQQVFKQFSLTETVIRLATVDPEVYQLISKDLSLQTTSLPFFAKAFNYLTPLFEQTAFFLFQIALSLYLAFHLFRKTVLHLKGERTFERPISDTIVKGFLVFMLFGLPVYPSSNTDVAPVPVVVGLVRTALLNVNNVATQVADFLIKLYADTVYNGTVRDIDLLERYYLVFRGVIYKQHIEVRKKYDQMCVIPSDDPQDASNPEYYIVNDKELRQIRFNPSVKDALQRAIYCRRLAMTLVGYMRMETTASQFLKQLRDLKQDIVSKKNVILTRVYQDAEELTNRTGFIATGVELPILHFLINKEILSHIKETVYSQSAFFVSNKPLDRQFEGLKQILPASIIVSIPPFSDLFYLIKTIAEAGIDFVVQPLKYVLIGLALVPIGIVGILVLTVANLILSIAGKVASTIIAFKITYYIAMITLPLIAIIGISLATLFRFIFFFVDLVVFVWSIPFSITAIVTGQAEDTLRKFVEEVMKFALLILLITIAPVFGISIMEITKFVVYQYMGEVITKTSTYTNSVGEFILLLLSSLIYVATQVLVIIYAFRITFKAPDFILEKVRLSISATSTLAEETYQTFTSKITPRF